jgi:hypothetical protein
MPLSTTNLVPSSGCIFGSWCVARWPEDSGASVEDIHYNFENRIGRQMGLIGNYMHFDDWTTTFPGTYQQRLANGGRLLFFRWKPDQAPGTAHWQDIANGQFDTYLTGVFTRMRDWQGGIGSGAVDTNKFFLAFHHEFDNGDYTTYGEAGDTAAQGYARYKSAWNHIRSVRNTVGATNVLMCWIVTGGSATNQANWLPAYPGDANVDWIGFEPYNSWNCLSGLNWRWPAQNWSTFLNWAQTNAPTPPIIIGEFGVTEHVDPTTGAFLSPSKADWFQDGTQGLVPTLKTSPYNRIKAISYFNSAPSCPNWIDTTSASMNGFKVMANDPFMLPDMSVGGGGGGGGSSSGQITPRAFSTGTNASSATPTVTVPATTQGGDVIGVFFTTSTTTTTITGFTAGYTTVPEVDDGSSQRTQVAWKIAAGTIGTTSSDASTTVGPTLSTTGSKTSLFCFVYSGNHETAPIEATAGVNETITQTGHTTPNVTTTTIGCWILSIWSDRGTVVSGVATNTSIWTLPTGETMRGEVYQTGNAATTLIASDTNQPHSPGTYGSKRADADFSNNNAVQWTIAIKPKVIASGGGAPGTALQRPGPIPLH